MFEELVHIRNETVDGIGPWHWIKEDNGAWDGPKKDWETNHKHKYFAHLKDTKVVVCAGGNQGMYPRLFAEKFDFVYTFEPDPLNFFVLSLNCQMDKIIKIQAALGNEPDSVAIKRECMTNTGMHKIEGMGMIPQLTLDSFKFPQIDLIQLDVEGYETNIISGALEHIARFRPVIACERATPEIIKMLEELNYQSVDQSVADAIFAPR